MDKKGTLPREIKKSKYKIRHCALRRCGLQVPVEIIFEIIKWYEMNAIAAYGGFPKRYPCWQFGMELEEQEKRYSYGLGKIYEMVINNDPCYAYLLEGNSLTDQQLVMAHVYAHADFFYNNVYFTGTNRKAIAMMENHRTKVLGYVEKFGFEKVEQWLEVCLILENLIDIHGSAIKRTEDAQRVSLLEREIETERPWEGRLQAKSYMDKFVNPPEEIQKRRGEIEAEEKRKREIEEKGSVIPAEPERDTILFLAEMAPLENWQRDILLMIREEAYYFAPQAQTKIMNEGWASYWHSVMMTQYGIAGDAGIVDYCDHNAGTLHKQPGRINPYPLGKAIFQSIEWRWNTHRHGPIYRDCEDLVILQNWEQFVVFKNIDEDCRGDQEEFNKRWQEFLCFWRGLKESGSGDLPFLHYDSNKLLLYWHYYHRLDEIIAKLDQEIEEKYLRDVLKFQKLRKEAKEGGNTTEEERRNFHLELAKECLDLVKRERALFWGLRQLRSVIRKGLVEPELFSLPEKFYSYAKKFPGKLPIAKGREKIFEIRKFYCDVTFIDDFLTLEVCEAMRLFTYEKNMEESRFEIKSREFEEIKKMLVAQLTNCGNPDIRIIDANYGRLAKAHELLLRHYVDGIFEVQLTQAKETLIKAVYTCWQRPVYLETAAKFKNGEEWEEKKIRFRCDGQEVSQETIHEFTERAAQ